MHWEINSAMANHEGVVGRAEGGRGHAEQRGDEVERENDGEAEQEKREKVADQRLEDEEKQQKETPVD